MSRIKDFRGIFSDGWTAESSYILIEDCRVVTFSVYLAPAADLGAKEFVAYDGRKELRFSVNRDRLTVMTFDCTNGKLELVFATNSLEPRVGGEKRRLGMLLVNIACDGVALDLNDFKREPSSDPGVADRLFDFQGVLRSNFDPVYYLSGLAEGRKIMLPLPHYMLLGWRENFDPSPVFSTSYYLSTNEDVLDAGVNPLLHYVLEGQKEGRRALPVRDIEYLSELDGGGARAAEGIESTLRKIAPFFVAEYYLRQIPGEADFVGKPIKHYFEIGWKRNLDPSEDFSTQYYLTANPDVAQLNINPLLHYAEVGIHEGRPCRHPGGERAVRLSKTVPFETRVNYWLKPRLPSPSLDSEALYEIFRRINLDQPRRLVLVFCHDDYTSNVGGVQLCIQLEQRLATEKDASYLAIYPTQPLPRLAHVDERDDLLLNCVLDGVALGAVWSSDLASFLNRAKDMFGDIHAVIHQLMGHSLEWVVEIIKAAGIDECWLWLHDFFTLCPSYALQRNDLSFCHAPNITSNACSLCLYRDERVSHFARFARFFSKLQVNLLSPSQSALDFWSSRTSLPIRSATVAPHLRLTRRTKMNHLATDGVPVRIAFLGTIAPIKGWPAFVELSKKLFGDTRYSFYYFGVGDEMARGVVRIPVRVTADNRRAMSDAVRRENIDYVIHWAGWMETFSFSTFEAFIGGAYVLTNTGSGNVQAAVRQAARGVAFEDTGALLKFFADGAAVDMASEIRGRRSRETVGAQTSEMSIPFILAQDEP